jgi:hypothetical protein
MPQRREIYAAMQKQTRKKSKKWVQNQKLMHPHVEKAHPYVEKAQPYVEKAHPYVEKAQPPTWKKLTAVSRCAVLAS